MNLDQVKSYRSKIKQIGTWAGTRMMKNRGVSIENAYFILFDRPMPDKYRS